jgi:hypothetical protein
MNVTLFRAVLARDTDNGDPNRRRGLRKNSLGNYSFYVNLPLRLCCPD